MANWMDEQDRRNREREWRRAESPGYGGEFAGRTPEERSFSPDQGYGGRGRGASSEDRYGYGGSHRGYDRGPVFGERETGARYEHSSRDRSGGDRAYGFDGMGPADRDRNYGEGSFGEEGYAMRGGGFGGRSETYDSPTWRGRAPREEAYERAYGGVRHGRIHDREDERGYRSEDRGFWDRASDEVASWFGDDEAERRRDRDHARNHRGRGPKGYVRSDERINDEVHHRLTDDSWLDASHIDVAVKDGEVTLSGHVEDRYAKHRAEHCVEDILGVKHVQNNLRVQESVDRPSAVTGEPGRMATNSTLAKATDGEL